MFTMGLKLQFALLCIFANGVFSEAQTYTSAVVANGLECAAIGRDVLNDKGSAVDAAIATLFCEGVVSPASMGLGGGFVATVYKKSQKKVWSLISREVAPLAAKEDMFENQPVEGGLAVAVPGELMGYWVLHQNYGKLPWKRLVLPSIALCQNGHKVSSYLANALKKNEDKIKADPTLKKIFINSNTNKVFGEGEWIYRPTLAETLEAIANEEANAIYGVNGTIGKKLVADIKKLGGIIELGDLWSYKVRWNEPVEMQLNDQYKLYTTALPTSGVVLSFILELLKKDLTPLKDLNWQRIVESFKHGYGQRTKLGDINDDIYNNSIIEAFQNMQNPKFIEQIKSLIWDDQTFDDPEYYHANFTSPEDHGTGNIAVIDENGDAITVTSTINNYFGAKIASESTGIILNDEMDDFSTTKDANSYGFVPSKENRIVPGKIPMSSMCPSIIIDNGGNARLLVGASGGSKIITGVALTIIRHLMHEEPLSMAMNQPRLHHQLLPMQVEYEEGFDKNATNMLRLFGHNLRTMPEDGFSAVTVIGYENHELTPMYDRRRGGSAERSKANAILANPLLSAVVVLCSYISFIVLKG